MNMTKKHIEATLSKMLHEYEHLAIQHLDSVKLLPVIDYGDQSRKLDDDFYGYRDKLLGIRDLIFTATYTPSPEYLLCLQVYDELVSLWNRFTDQVLSLARESRLRRDNQPVFAPTTQAVELVLVPSVIDSPDSECPLCKGSGLQGEFADYLGCNYCSGTGIAPVSDAA